MNVRDGARMAFTATTVLLCTMIFLSCTKSDNRLSSKNYSDTEKIKIIKEKIEVKSPIEWTEFELFDVNGDARSIPGPSSKDYKIVIKVHPDFIAEWTKNKQGWITPTQLGNDWKYNILNKEQLSAISNVNYTTYYKEDSGCKYTLWINNERGIVIIRYSQE